MRNSFVKFTNCSLESLRQLSKGWLMDLQADYYNKMLENEARDSIFTVLSHNRDEVVTVESWKRGADNSFQFDMVMKCSKPSLPALPRKLHGTALLKKRVLWRDVHWHRYEKQLYKSKHTYSNSFLCYQLQTNPGRHW